MIAISVSLEVPLSVVIIPTFNKAFISSAAFAIIESSDLQII
jgi:hypothetical protein